MKKSRFIVNTIKWFRGKVQCFAMWFLTLVSYLLHFVKNICHSICNTFQTIVKLKFLFFPLISNTLVVIILIIPQFLLIGRFRFVYKRFVVTTRGACCHNTNRSIPSQYVLEILITEQLIVEYLQKEEHVVIIPIIPFHHNISSSITLLKVAVVQEE